MISGIGRREEEDTVFLKCVCVYLFVYGGFPGGSEVKVSACNAGDLGSIPGLGRSPGEGNGNPFQYSCLENPMDRGGWWAIVHGITESDTIEQLHFTSLHFNIQKNTIKLKFIPLANIFRIPGRVLGAKQMSKDIKDLTP